MGEEYYFLSLLLLSIITKHTSLSIKDFSKNQLFTETNYSIIIYF